MTQPCETHFDEPKQSFTGIIQHASLSVDRILVSSENPDELIAIGYLETLLQAAYLIMHQQMFLDALKIKHVSDMKEKVLDISASGTLNSCNSCDPMSPPVRSPRIVMRVREISHAQVIEKPSPAVLALTDITPNPNVILPNEPINTVIYTNLSTSTKSFLGSEMSPAQNDKLHEIQSNSHEQDESLEELMPDVDKDKEKEQTVDDSVAQRSATEQLSPLNVTPEEVQDQPPSAQYRKEKKQTTVSSSASSASDNPVAEEKEEKSKSQEMSVHLNETSFSTIESVSSQSNNRTQVTKRRSEDSTKKSSISRIKKKGTIQATRKSLRIASKGPK
ncbi:hypothetical protein BD560DRAFT_439786 [Blakeslea trispora]|nr:hypothetical protein BD560DRAFT_439786 [Blakeslea trispora]